MTYNSITDDTLSDFDISDFSDFSKARERIIFRLLRQQPEDAVCIDLLDLKLSFAYIVKQTGNDLASITIRSRHIADWGVSIEELLSAAKLNTPSLLPVSLENMYRILAELCRDDDIIEPLPSDMAFPMYVLTNTIRLYGACALLYDGTEQLILSSIDDDCYILPSSIHELILVPASHVDCRGTLDDMIRQVNTTSLSEHEILSDHAYLYSQIRDSIAL